MAVLNRWIVKQNSEMKINFDLQLELEGCLSCWVNAYSYTSPEI